MQRWVWIEGALAWSADGAVLLRDRRATSRIADLYEEVPARERSRAIRAHGGRVRAFTAIAAGDEDAAADAFADALGAARSDGRHYCVAPVVTDYGMWLAESGRTEEAAPLLDEAQALWEQVGATRWLEHIAAARPRERVEA